MTQKATDLARQMGLKINGKMRTAGAPDRFAGAAGAPDRRAQRDAERAAGLVPFACKLPAGLAKRAMEQAASHPGGINALIAEALGQKLDAAQS